MAIVLPTSLLSLTAVVLCFVPLFDLLGYEFSFAMGLVAVPCTFFVGLVVGRRNRSTLAALRRALPTALLSLLPALALISLNALRVRNCDFGEGLLFFALLPCATAVYASTLGVAVSRVGSRGWPSALALGALILGAHLTWSLWILYSHPPIFAFDHLWGWFSGSLYDEGTSVGTTLWLFRLGTGVRTVAVIVALIALERLAPNSRPRAAVAIATALAATWTFDATVGPQAGYRVRRNHIEAALPMVVERAGLRIHLPRDTDAALARAVADDHAFRLAQLAARLQIQLDPADSEQIIDSYVYANASSKARWMGGRGTMIAKPWLGEIHVHDRRPRHPVVAHELVHALAARFASGPFAVTGRGLQINLGLIEGLAEALTAARGPLDVHRAARAMRKQGRAPDVRSLMSTTGFWAQSPRRAYTVAGSFVSFLIDEHGPAPLIEAYERGDFERAYGRPLTELIDGWVSFVDSLDVLPRDEWQAEERFRRPSIFERPCAHVISALRTRVHRADPDSAVELQREICRHLGESASARLELARALERAGEDAAFWALSDELLGDGLNTIQKAGLQELRGMLSWKRSDFDAARAAFSTALDARASLASERLQWVRLWALEGPSPLRNVMRTFLAREMPPIRAVYELTELAKTLPDDPTIPYLIARQLYQSEAWTRSLELLERVSAHPFEAIETERLRLIAEAHLKLGQYEHARAALERHAAATPTSGARSRALDLLDRVAWLVEQRAAGQRSGPQGVPPNPPLVAE